MPMKQEQVSAMEQLGRKAELFGGIWPKVFESAFFVHGYICGGMPLGFRAGVWALKQLAAERELNMGKLVFVETGTGHAAGCFADGVQMATGCTFGKGLMSRTEYGKWALTVVDKESLRAARVSVRPEVIEAAFQSPFVKARREGVPPTEVPVDVSVKLVENLFAKKEEELFVAKLIERYELPRGPKPTFNIVRCAACGEVVAENKLRLKDGKPMCIPCSGYRS